MRDIKQYFADGAKIDKIKSIDNLEHIREEQEDSSFARDSRTRKRVKIRISRSDSKERICDIIEEKNDLIDKTPSPFAKVNDGGRISQGKTSKFHLAGSSTKQDLEECDIVVIGNKHENMEDTSQDMNSKQSEDKLDEQMVANLIDLSDNTSMKNVYDKSLSNIKFCDDIGSQREESNAFQVLMSHSKPIQYKSLPQQSIEDIEFNKKSVDVKLKFKHKEKLIALANKKGYFKRKLADEEESERIERNIENRIKLFKHDNGKDDNIELPIKNNRQFSGSLLDYFSKSPLELINKDIKCMSTFIVKADVHRTETTSIEPVLKPISNKIYSIKRSPKTDLDLSKVDDIHVIASEDLTSPLTTKEDKRQKSRWSLRIKLHSSEDNDKQNDTTDDELFSPRSRSKFNTVTRKSRKLADTYVENNKFQSKHHNGHIKKKVRDEEENVSFDKKDNSDVQTNISEDSTVNNNYKDMCLIKSGETSKMEQIYNNVCETIITVADDSECEIINENVSKKKPNKKLAPVFMKRRKTDPAIVAAKRLFLQSDISDAENKTTDRKTNNSILTLPFPIISHVTQLENNSHPNKEQIQHKFLTKIERKYLPSINIAEYKCITNYNETPKLTETVDKPVTKNFDLVLSEIQKYCLDVQKIWKTVSTIKRETEKKPLQRTRGNRKTKTLERKSPLAESVDASQPHDCTWTCKYKPMSVQEMIGNEEAAAKLKDWLSRWRMSLAKEDYSSGEEFYSSDSCSKPYDNEHNQTAVLLGPHGSGKSASVYAIAEELGYRVLEVNASSRRTGKRILKEFEEATQSHRIKKNKHKSSFEQVAKESDAPNISQNSLILLEDIDLIFEEDEGFISAAYQLALNTKRPIVMTCNNVCQYLSKMAPQQKKIYFQRVNGNRVSALLELISLAETGYRLPHNFLAKLLQMGDLRRALLQLQYLLLSGLPVLSDQSTIVSPSIWQDMQHYLYKPAIKLNKRYKAKKYTKDKKLNEQTGSDTTHILSNLANDLDGLSLMLSLIDIDDSVLNTPETNMQPSLSLAENLSLYTASRYLSMDIASFLSNRILYKDSSGNEQVQNLSNVVLRNELNQGVDLALSHVTPVCLDRRVMAIDYLPTARTICRAEESRSAGNHKRGNRFFHYLHGLKVPAASMKPNILVAACRTLQEKIDKNVSTSNAVNINSD